MGRRFDLAALSLAFVGVALAGGHGIVLTGEAPTAAKPAKPAKPAEDEPMFFRGNRRDRRRQAAERRTR
jgi:hypothetical protein